MNSSPEVGASISVMMRASVDLPQPLSPTIASVLPFSTVKLTPLTACTVRGLREQAAADMVVAHDVAAFEDDLAHRATPGTVASSSTKPFMVGSRSPIAFSGSADSSSRV